MRRYQYIIALVCMLFCIDTHASRIQKISSKEGISNNAVFNIYQTDLGELYLGTLDGLNIWDGQKMQLFEASDAKRYFAGNKIRHVFQYDKQNILLLTRYGLAKLNLKTKDIDFYEDFALHSMLGLDKNGNIFSIDENRRLQYYDFKSNKFQTITGFNMDPDAHCLRMTVSDNGNLYIFSNIDSYQISFKQGTKAPEINEIRKWPYQCRYISQPHCSSPIFIVTEDFIILSFDPADGSSMELERFNFPAEQMHHDVINGVVETQEGWYISFWDAVYFLKKGEMNLKKLDIGSHIFTMVKDRNQPIIWMGSDCNGLIQYKIEKSPLKCITYDQFPHKINMPVRSILKDDNGNLWVGTKGNGLLKVRDFSEDANFDPSKTELFNINNSSINNNSVYLLRESHHNGFYIGTEGKGINWYSHRSGKISQIKGSSSLSDVYNTVEQGDSVLWVTTGESKAYKCIISTENGIPVIDRIETLDFLAPFGKRAAIFPVSAQNDTTLWFGSKGHGALCHFMNSGTSRLMQFPKDYGYACNEVTYIHKGEDILFATPSGLIVYDDEADKTFLSKDVSDCSAKAALSDASGNIWVSTNSGMTVLDCNYKYLRSYDAHTGLSVLEYSDAACYRDPRTGTLYFGGINGFCMISESSVPTKYSYNPPIQVTEVTHGNSTSPIDLSMKDEKLEIEYSESAYSLKFLAIDYLYQSSHKFVWSIDGDQENPTDGFQIHLPRLSPGSYTLKIWDSENPDNSSSIEIKVIPPFYLSTWAYVIYALFIVLAIFLTVRSIRKKYVSMKKKLQTEYAEQIKQIKQETNAAITDELSVQTTFILGLCQQIRSQTKSNAMVSEKVSLVEHNIGKIRKTLQLLNAFKNISETSENETDRSLIMADSISKEMLEIAESSKEFKGISLTYEIGQNISVSTNQETYLAFFKTLLNTAKALATGKKKIHISISNDNAVTISASITSDFDLYNTLYEKEISVCENMTTRMGAAFTHKFNGGNALLSIEFPEITLEETYEQSEDILNFSIGKAKADLEYIYIICNNKETSSFLSYFMADRYNIVILQDIEAVIAQIKDKMPSAIIYDISSMMKHFKEFFAKIKEDKSVNQIPVIVLASYSQVSEKEECIKAGVDLCMTFPFNVETLNTALDNLQSKREKLAEYYKLPTSSFTVYEGNLIHSDDKQFIKRIKKIIDEGISNPNLSAPMIAEGLGISTRVLYRKLEGLTEKTLKQIIIEVRMKSAAALLTSTKLNIDEIMYKVGYDNASTFYRSFKTFHGMTPKEYRDNILKG